MSSYLAVEREANSYVFSYAVEIVWQFCVWNRKTYLWAWAFTKGAEQGSKVEHDGGGGGEENFLPERKDMLLFHSTEHEHQIDHELNKCIRKSNEAVTLYCT
jgi:hypothetical protein